MQFHQSSAEIFVPDGLRAKRALARTTHMAIGAHQDDIEIMAAAPILECFQDEERWFSGVVLTDGRGSPRDDLYENYSDDQMRQVRMKEQRKAAVIGEYGSLVMLDFPSKVVKNGADDRATKDIVLLLGTARPRYVYTHNLADKHDTHVAVAIRVIRAIRNLPASTRPQQLYGCVVWRDLDWMVDEDKVTFDLSTRDNLQSALIGVFDSQIWGGKRYDLATMGRRRADATYFESHLVDASQRLAYAMDLTPLIIQPDLDIGGFLQAFINRFAADVVDRLERLL